MFKDTVYAGSNAFLRSPAAQEYNDKIWGDGIEGDLSFVSTLRALLCKRADLNSEEGRFVVFRYNVYNVDSARYSNRTVSDFFSRTFSTAYSNTYANTVSVNNILGKSDRHFEYLENGFTKDGYKRVEKSRLSTERRSR